MSHQFTPLCLLTKHVSTECFFPSSSIWYCCLWFVCQVECVRVSICVTQMENKSNTLSHCWNAEREKKHKSLQAIRFIESCTDFFAWLSLFLCQIPLRFFFSYRKKTTIFETMYAKLIIIVIAQSKEEFHIALSCHQPSSQMHFFHCIRSNGETKKMWKWAFQTSDELQWNNGNERESLKNNVVCFNKL